MNEPAEELEAVHLCTHCGHRIRRNEMKATDMISGVIACPICNTAEPLNVVIQSTHDRKPPTSVGES